MERIVKLFIFGLIISICTLLPANANETMSLSTLISTQHVNFENCIKVFNVDNVKLFHLTIAAINANRFKIYEIQTTHPWQQEFSQC